MMISLLLFYDRILPGTFIVTDLETQHFMNMLIHLCLINGGFQKVCKDINSRMTNIK